MAELLVARPGVRFIPNRNALGYNLSMQGVGGVAIDLARNFLPILQC